ncbi:MAG: hypothetical protein H7Y01_06445, partial [Ferruginibacter sp.]|nr:hypothetical protein [Chitinophagaceae bacterium]
MQFDEFDNKAKKAADHHHPAYDEQAWTKMEKLLNTHMPQKEDDRRRFLFLLLILFGLGAAGLLIAKPWKNRKAITASAPTVQHQQPASSIPVTPLIKNNTVPADIDQPAIVPIQLNQPGNLEGITKFENKQNPTPPLAPLNFRKENNQLGQPADKLTTGTNRDIKNGEPASAAAESLPNSKTNPVNGVVKNN